MFLITYLVCQTKPKQFFVEFCEISTLFHRVVPDIGVFMKGLAKSENGNSWVTM